MRGFDTWDGFLAGGQDHFTQKSFGECGCAQNDIWVNGTIDPGLHGEYNAQRFTAAAVARIRNHDPATPLFLYVALQNVHAPLEADAAAMALYPDETYTLRRTFSAMMSTIDSSVANITAALRAAGMWDTTAMLWQSDNGSPVDVGGSNWPLRGGKGTNFEGGTRVPALFGGGLVPSAMRGTNLTGLFHVSDIYATVCGLAGVDASDGDIAPVDGLDAWPWLSGAAPASPRTRIVHEHSMFAPGNATGALRDGDWKLIVNTEPWAGWYGEKSSGHFTPPRSGPTTNVQACSPTAPCLFNVAVDPEERLDVASSNPSKVEELLAIFRSYDISYHPPRTAPVRNSKACCAMGQYLQPWG